MSQAAGMVKNRVKEDTVPHSPRSRSSMLGEFGEVRGCRKGWILKALIRVKGFYLLIIYLLWLLLGMILFHSRPWSITEEVILESQGIFEGRQLAIYIGFFFFF